MDIVVLIFNTVVGNIASKSTREEIGIYRVTFYTKKITLKFKQAGVRETLFFKTEQTCISGPATQNLVVKEAPSRWEDGNKAGYRSNGSSIIGKIQYKGPGLGIKTWHSISAKVMRTWVALPGHVLAARFRSATRRLETGELWLHRRDTIQYLWPGTSNWWKISGPAVMEGRTCGVYIHSLKFVQTNRTDFAPYLRFGNIQANYVHSLSSYIY